jgi:hypothetical protein
LLETPETAAAAAVSCQHPGSALNLFKSIASSLGKDIKEKQIFYVQALLSKKNYLVQMTQ